MARPIASNPNTVVAVRTLFGIVLSPYAVGFVSL